MHATWKVPVGTARISERARHYVDEVLTSGWLSPGPFTRRLETLMAEAHEVGSALFCNSGTSALQCAIAALKELDDWDETAEIIVPAITFIASASTVITSHLRPVFADVDPRTYNLDVEAAERACTSRTRAIMPCHLFGQPCNMDPLLALARRRGLRVIEDSCDTVLASYRGRRVGSFGDVSCFSTRSSHLISTGIGGFVCTSDPDIARVVASLMHDGRADPRASAEPTTVERRFHFTRPGFNHRATEMEAALGVAQLEESAARVATHRRNASRLGELLAECAPRLQLPWWPEDTEHSFSVYPLVLDAPRPCKSDVLAFLAGRGIETRDMFPLVTQPFIRARFGDLAATLPAAQRINERGFYVGCHEDLDDDALALTARAVCDALG